MPAVRFKYLVNAIQVKNENIEIDYFRVRSYSGDC